MMKPERTSLWRQAARNLHVLLWISIVLFPAPGHCLYLEDRMVLYWDFYNVLNQDLTGEWRDHHPSVPLDSSSTVQGLVTIHVIHETYARNPSKAMQRAGRLWREHHRDIIGVAALAMEGLIADVTNDERKARQVYERALGQLLQIDPNPYGAAHCPLGYVLGTLTANLHGTDDRAVTLWRTLVAANPDNPQPRRALQLLTRFREPEPGPLILYFRAQRSRRRLTRENRYEEALTRYPTHPMAPYIQVALAEAVLEQAGKRDARPYYERLLMDHPKETFPCEDPGEPGWPIAPYAHYVLGLLNLVHDPKAASSHLREGWSFATVRKSTDAYSITCGVALMVLSGYKGLTDPGQARLANLMLSTLRRPAGWTARPLFPVLFEPRLLAPLKQPRDGFSVATRLLSLPDIPLDRIGWEKTSHEMAHAYLRGIGKEPRLVHP